MEDNLMRILRRELGVNENVKDDLIISFMKSKMPELKKSWEISLQNENISQEVLSQPSETVESAKTQNDTVEKTVDSDVITGAHPVPEQAENKEPQPLKNESVQVQSELDKSAKSDNVQATVKEIPKTVESDVSTGVHPVPEQADNKESQPLKNESVQLSSETEKSAQTDNVQVIVKEIPKTNVIPQPKKMIRIANGMEGKEYTELLGVDGGLLFDFKGLDEIGLKYDDEKSELIGFPKTAGEHKIQCLYKPKGWVDGKPVLQRELLFTVNPDPRKLWKNNPTPKDIEYYKEDSACDYVTVKATKEGGFCGIGKHDVPQKDIVAASQRGRSHANEGKPRDDDFRIAFISETSWYIMAVADGAGSAQFSRKGSQIACETVLDFCKSKLIKSGDLDILIESYNKEKGEDCRKKVGDCLYGILVNAVFNAKKAIEKEAYSKSSAAKNYATTLLLTVCKKFDFGWFVASFWVGDGAVAIYNKSDRYLKVMGEPDGGEYAGQTRFLTMSEIFQSESLYKRLRFEIIEDFTAVMLMTDGISDPKFETDANLQKIEKWDELWEDINKEVQLTDDNEDSKNQLLNWLDFWSKGNHDDRTIAILY